MRSRAKLTTSTLLAVATPMHMIAPVSAGTLTGVSDRNSIHTIPASAAGSAVMMMNGSSQDWKLTTIKRYTSTIAAAIVLVYLLIVVNFQSWLDPFIIIT